MTAKMVTAFIRWRTPEEGGRDSLPGGSRYITIAGFDPETPNWPEEAWSLVVEPIPPGPFPAVGRCAIHFLMGDAAPEAVLERGRRFKLFEGKRIVAEGEVVDDSQPSSVSPSR